MPRHADSCARWAAMLMHNDTTHSAQGIFETLAVVNGQPRLLERHISRLFEGCRRLGMQLPSEASLVTEIGKHCKAAGTGVIKIIVPHRGVADADLEPIVCAEPPRRRPIQWWRDGVSIITCRTRLALQPQLAGLKLLDRSAQHLARAEWTSNSISEGLMLDTEGRLVGGTMTNFYAVIAGVIKTPAITHCGVAGVMRAALLDHWQARGQPTLICELEADELKDASEVFLTNALIGVWPVRSLDKRAYATGPIARAAQAWVQRIVKGPSLPAAVQR